MIEKKLIALSVFAIAIGMATILPLEYLMSAQVVQAAAVEPWFNVNVTYAYCDPNKSGGNNTIDLSTYYFILSFVGN